MLKFMEASSTYHNLYKFVCKVQKNANSQASSCQNFPQVPIFSSKPEQGTFHIIIFSTHELGHRESYWPNGELKNGAGAHINHVGSSVYFEM